MIRKSPPSSQDNQLSRGLFSNKQILGLTIATLFLANLDAQATPPLDWTYSFGASRFDDSAPGNTMDAIAVDTNGEVLVAGSFGNQFWSGSVSADFDPSPEVESRLTAGNRDVVVVRLSPKGNFVSALTFGGGGDDHAIGLIVLPDRSFVVAGNFSDSVDFDPGPVEHVIHSSGESDVFLSRYDFEGSHIWTRTVGSTGDDRTWGLTRHPNGGMVLYGEFELTVDFDPGSAVEQRTSAGGDDGFAARFDADGNLLSVFVLGGTSADRIYGVAVDDDGALFAAGSFRNTVDFDPDDGHAIGTAAGHDDAFLCRFNADGSFAWVWTIGSTNQDVATDIKLGRHGDPFVVGLFGTTNGIDFDPTIGSDVHPSSGSQTTFVTHLGADQSYHWTRTTSTSSATGYAFANTLAASDSTIVVAGAGRGVVDFSSFEPVSNTLDLRSQECFVWGMNVSGDFEWVLSLPNLSPDAWSIPIDVSFTPLGNLLYAGFFSGTPDFDPGPGTILISASGGINAFAAQMRQFFPSADHDGNERVDLRDLSAFQTCFGSVSTETACQHFDFNENLGIDGADHGFVVIALTGPMQPEKHPH